MVAYLRNPAGAGSIWPAEGMAKEYSSFLEYGHDSRQNNDEEPRPKHIVVAGQCAAALQQSCALVPFVQPCKGAPRTQAAPMALKVSEPSGT